MIITKKYLNFINPFILLILLPAVFLAATMSAAVVSAEEDDIDCESLETEQAIAGCLALQEERFGTAPGGLCRDDEVEIAINPGGDEVIVRTEEDDDGNEIRSYCVPEGNGVDGNAIIAYLRMAVRFLAGGVGLVIALVMVIGGIEYVTSAGNPEKVAHAKKRLIESSEALILFIFMAAILNYFIPGGLF